MASKAVLVRRQQEAAKRDRGETAARNSSVIDFNDHLNPEYQLQKVNEFWHGVRHKSVRNLKYTSYDENDDNDDDDSDVDRAKNFATSPNKSSSGRLSAFASLRSFSRRSSLSFSFLNDKPSDEPQGSFKVAWDVLICILVVYSLVIIPIGIGFETSPETPSLIIDNIVTALFCVDIIISFNTAYEDVDTEKLEYDRLHIAKHYIRFWFWIDLLSTIPFDDIVSSIVSGGGLGAIRAIRVLRLVRLAKLYRLANIDESLEQYHISPSMVNLIILVIQIFFVAHYFACFWHFLSLDNIQKQGPPRNWVDVFGFDSVNVYGRYVASLYYIIVTMLTIGYGDISPTNDIERIYGIFTMLTGAVVFGALTSKVASIIERRNPEAKALKESMNELKSLMMEFKYDRELKMRVKSAYQYYLTKKSPFGEVEFFDELPQPIMHRLFRQLYGAHISKVHLFQEFEKVFVVPLLRDLKPMNAVKDEVIYGQNDVCNEVVFVTLGSVGMFVTDRRDHYAEHVEDINKATTFSRLELKSSAPKVFASGCMIGYITAGYYFGDIEHHLNISSIGTYVANTYTQLLSIGHRTLDIAKGESLSEAHRFEKCVEERMTALKDVLRPIYPRTVDDIRKYEITAAKEKAAPGESQNVSEEEQSPNLTRKRKGSVRRNRVSSISSRITDGLPTLRHTQMEVALRAFAHRWELASIERVKFMHSNKSLDHSKVLPAEVAAMVPAAFRNSPVIDAPKAADDGVNLEVECVKEFHINGCVPEIWLDGEIVTVNMVTDALQHTDKRSEKLVSVVRSLNEMDDESDDSSECEIDPEEEEEERNILLFRAVVNYKIDRFTKKRKPIIKDITEHYYTEHYLLNPIGYRKIYWDFFIGFLIIYSVIVVPVEIAFDSLAYPGSDVVDLIINGFFLLDIIASFRTAYRDELLDAIVTTDLEVAQAYIKSWFPVDFISTVPFDSIVAAAVRGGSATLALTRLLKIIRLFRLLKMARLLKLSSYVEAAEDVLGVSPAVFGLLAMFVIVFFLSHWVACILWGMSTVLSENRWYEQDELVYSDFSEKSLARQYLLALYWTVTIMTTVGYGDISPINSYDRILNIFVLLLAGSTFGYMIANVSDLIQSLNESDAQRAKKLSDIADFLDEKECQQGIRNEVMKHFTNKYREDTAFDLSRIWNRLPPRLAIKIQLSHHDSKLKTIPICANLLNDSVRLYIFELLEAQFFETRQKIVEQGAKSEEIFFFVSGSAIVFFDEGAAISQSCAYASKEQSGHDTKHVRVALDGAVEADGGGAMGAHDEGEDESKTDDNAGSGGEDEIDGVADADAAVDAEAEAAGVRAEGGVDSCDDEGLELVSSRGEGNDGLVKDGASRATERAAADPTSANTAADTVFADVAHKGLVALESSLIDTLNSFSRLRKKLNADFKSMNQVKRQTFQDENDDDDDDEDENVLFENRLEGEGAEFNWTPACFERVGLKYIYEIEPFKTVHREIGLFCGHISLFNDSNYLMSVVAKTDCVVYVLTKTKIERLIREEPTVGRQLEESLAMSIDLQRSIISKTLMDRNVEDLSIRSQTMQFMGDLRPEVVSPSNSAGALSPEAASPDQ